jgi:hypothetical protein
MLNGTPPQSWIFLFRRPQIGQDFIAANIERAGR